MSIPQILVAAPTDTASGQAAQIANLARLVQGYASEIATLSAAGGAAPSVFGAAYANTTGRVVLAHYQAPNTVGGVGQGSAAEFIAGYKLEIAEDQAMGVDGWAVDTGSITDPGYLFRIDCIFKAAEQTGFKILLTPDYSSVGEDPASVTTLATLFLKYAHSTATLTYQGRPALSTYAGDGGGVSVVAAVYNPLLAQIRAGVGGYPGVNVFFVPGWANVDELNAVGADGAWSFPSGPSPLSAAAPLANQEALGAAVQASRAAAGVPRLFMQSMFPSRYWDADGRNGHFYNEFAGARAFAASMMSAIDTVKPQWIVLLTKNDFNESMYSSLARTSTWTGLLNSGVPDFWQNQDGLHLLMSYYIQWYKTGVQPTIAQDVLILFNRTQTAAASYAPAADPHPGISYVTGVLGEPPGLLDRVDYAALLTKSSVVQISGVGPQQQQFSPAGISFGTFLGVTAGTPTGQLVQQGQVTKQVQGHPIAPTATLVNLNVASVASAPGIAFSLTVPLPVGFPLDRAALFVRSTKTQNAPGAIGVCNLSASDNSVSPPATFAQNSLNNPAGVGSLLDHSTAAGQDAVQQYNGNGYAALYPDPLGLYPAPLAYNTNGNTNCCYFMAGNGFPSSKVVASVRVVSTSTDPNADGQGGVALVNSQAPGGHYQGQGVFGYIEKYAGGYTLTVKAEDNLGSDSMSSGPSVLGSIPVNSLAPGEWYDLTATADLVARTVTFTARPSNQHL